MTDIELCIACAGSFEQQSRDMATGLPRVRIGENFVLFDPLHDNAQAMALQKRFKLASSHHRQPPDECWEVWSFDRRSRAVSVDLNRAICICVATNGHVIDKIPVKAKLHVAVICPSCNLLMGIVDGKYLVCQDERCATRGVKWAMPTVELEKLDELKKP